MSGKEYKKSKKSKSKELLRRVQHGDSESKEELAALIATIPSALLLFSLPPPPRMLKTLLCTISILGSSSFVQHCF